MIGLLLILIASLLVASLAAAAETTLTAVYRTPTRYASTSSLPGNSQDTRFQANPNPYLATILAINTAAVVTAATVTTLLISRYLHNWPQIAGAAILTLLVLIFCEIIPKALALHFPAGFGRALSGPIYWLTKLLSPLVGAITLLARLLLHPLIHGRAFSTPALTEADLLLMLEVGEQKGVLNPSEKRMIHGILNLADQPIRELMVPRVDLVAVEQTAPLSSAVQMVFESGYTRIPLFSGDLDNIIGILYAKDLLQASNGKTAETTLEALARPPFFSPESKLAGQLLQEMQERKVHIAIVVDEHGGTAGLVTLEDILEEIVGPIRDEYDAKEVEGLRVLSPSEILVDGRYPLADLREQVSLDWGEAAEADTLAGLIYERLGVIPKVGTTLDLGAATATVESVSRQRVGLVRILSQEPFLVE